MKEYACGEGKKDQRREGQDWSGQKMHGLFLLLRVTNYSNCRKLCLRPFANLDEPCQRR
jgi:hypothetical protein